MKSMTCYGFASKKVEFGMIEVSIKSVNGRYLEVRSNYPPEYLKFESEIKRKVSEVLKRGSVSVYIHRKRDSSLANAKVVFRKALAKKWMGAYGELAKELKMKAQPTLEIMSQIPNLFSVEEDSSVSTQEQRILMTLISKALKECEKEKVREGQALKKEIRTYIAELSRKMQKIKMESQKQQEMLKKDHESKSQVENLVDVTTDQRLAQEVSSQIDRMDISEEIFRFKEHLKSIQKHLNVRDQLGKKLDFYTQELLREMNTVGSKSQVFKITQSVVDCKTIIEKIREQSQNIE